MIRLRALTKEYNAPASATSGLAGYDLEGQRKRRVNAALAPFGFEVRDGSLRRLTQQERDQRQKRGGTLHPPTGLSKGDVDGHEFHGNQYTDGGSAAAGAKDAARQAKGYEATAEHLRQTRPSLTQSIKATERRASTMHGKAAERHELARKAAKSPEVAAYHEAQIKPHAESAKLFAERGALKVKKLLLKATSADREAHAAATSPFNLRPQPTEGQQRAGNYKKGSFRIGGLDVRIENPAGSYRRPEWPELKSHYGYFPGTRGADGDPVDCFVRVGTPLDYDGPAYVINQYVDGKYDEAKVMVGWHSWDEARAAYLANFTPDWDGLKSGVELTLPQLRDWLRNGEPDQELDQVAASLVSPRPDTGAIRAWVNKKYLADPILRKLYQSQYLSRLLPV